MRTKDMLYLGILFIPFLNMYLIIYKYYICFMLITATFVEEAVRLLTAVNYDYLYLSALGFH